MVVGKLRLRKPVGFIEVFVEPMQSFADELDLMFVKTSIIQQSMGGLKDSFLETRILVNFWNHKSHE